MEWRELRNNFVLFCNDLFNSDSRSLFGFRNYRASLHARMRNYHVLLGNMLPKFISTATRQRLRSLHADAKYEGTLTGQRRGSRDWPCRKTSFLHIRTSVNDRQILFVRNFATHGYLSILVVSFPFCISKKDTNSCSCRIQFRGSLTRVCDCCVLFPWFQ